MSNVELIKAARESATAGRKYAEYYSGANPPDSVPGKMADLIDALADALETAGAVIAQMRAARDHFGVESDYVDAVDAILREVAP